MDTADPTLHMVTSAALGAGAMYLLSRLGSDQDDAPVKGLTGAGLKNLTTYNSGSESSAEGPKPPDPSPNSDWYLQSQVENELQNPSKMPEVDEDPVNARAIVETAYAKQTSRTGRLDSKTWWTDFDPYNLPGMLSLSTPIPGRPFHLRVDTKGMQYLTHVCLREAQDLGETEKELKEACDGLKEDAKGRLTVGDKSQAFTLLDQRSWNLKRMSSIRARKEGLEASAAALERAIYSCECAVMSAEGLLLVENCRREIEQTVFFTKLERGANGSLIPASVKNRERERRSENDNLRDIRKGRGVLGSLVAALGLRFRVGWNSRGDWETRLDAFTEETDRPILGFYFRYETGRIHETIGFHDLDRWNSRFRLLDFMT